MEHTFRLTYGTDSIKLTCPDSHLAGPLINVRDPKEQADKISGPRTIEEALQKPLDSPPLRELVTGKRVAVIINDEWRYGRQEEIIHALAKEVAVGRPALFRVFIATGSHEPELYAQNASEWARKAARDANIDVEILPNNCDTSPMIEVGTTQRGTPVVVQRAWMECEVRIFGHEAKHHYMAGYSTIDKQFLPGVSSRKTIEHNHKLSLQTEKSMAGRIPYHTDPERQDNPFSADAIEARQLSERYILNPANSKLEERAATTFVLDMISDSKAIHWVRSGKCESVEREMTTVADVLAAFSVEKTRYVVISPGGPPASTAIYGVQNCFEMALKGAIKDGGEALVIAPCEGRPGVPEEAMGLAGDLKSKQRFWDNQVKLLSLPIDEASQHIKDNFELYLWKTDRCLKLVNQHNLKIYLYCELPEDTLQAGGFYKATDPQAWIDERVKRNDGSIRFIDNGNKMLVLGSE